MNNSVHDIARLQEQIDQKRYESARLALAQRVLDRRDELEGLLAVAYEMTETPDDGWGGYKTPQYILDLSREFATLDRLAYPEAWTRLEEAGGDWFEGEMGS